MIPGTSHRASVARHEDAVSAVSHSTRRGRPETLFPSLHRPRCSLCSSHAVHDRYSSPPHHALCPTLPPSSHPASGTDARRRVAVAPIVIDSSSSSAEIKSSENRSSFGWRHRDIGELIAGKSRCGLCWRAFHDFYSRPFRVQRDWL